MIKNRAVPLALLLGLLVQLSACDQYQLSGAWKGIELGSNNNWDLKFKLNLVTNEFAFTTAGTNMNGVYDFADIPNGVNEITFTLSSGEKSYGIYSVFPADNTMLLAFCDAGLPVRPVDFTPNNSTTVIKAIKLDTPQQIHIAYGDDPHTMITVSWITQVGIDNSLVQYGLSPGKLSMSSSATYHYYHYDTYKSGAIYYAAMNNLQPNTRYYYRCGSDQNNLWSDEFSFITAPTEDSTVNVTVFGDLNLGGSVGGAPFTWNISHWTMKWVEKDIPNSHFVLNVGDIAYCAGDQTCWDKFFLDVQPVAARQPWMVCYGNHDVFPEPFGYTNRFFMPGHAKTNVTSKSGEIPKPLVAPDVSQENYFFSFDVGPIHFVGVSTELYFYPQNATVTAQQQLEWLENDLAYASASENRTQRPWIVAFGHRPIYCSHSYEDCHNDVALLLQRDWEPLFFNYGVDMFIFGHIHSMERSWPISFDGEISGNYNKPRGTVHVLSGAAGQGFLGPWSPQPAWSAWRTNTHGYSRLFANKQKLTFQYVETVHGTVVDTITLATPWLGLQQELRTN